MPMIHEPPYGYEFKIIIDDQEAEVIKNIFYWYTELSWNVERIVRKLNDSGIPSPQNATWHKPTVNRILTNSTYCNEIISQETFEKAKEVRNRKSSGDMSQSKYDYPFSNILHCSNCGSPYHGRKSGKKYKSYACYNKCGEESISELILEKLVLSKLQDMGEYKETRIKWNDLTDDERKSFVQRHIKRIEIKDKQITLLELTE